MAAWICPLSSASKGVHLPAASIDKPNVALFHAGTLTCAMPVVANYGSNVDTYDGNAGSYQGDSDTFEGNSDFVTYGAATA